MEMRDAVRAALGAWFLIAVSGCVTRGEFDKLQKQVEGMHEAPLPMPERLRRVQEDRDKLEATFTHDALNSDPKAKDIGETRLKDALKDADSRPRRDGGVAPSKSDLKSYECKTNICKGVTTLADEETYKKFVSSAFGAGPHQIQNWFHVTTVDACGTGVTVTFYHGYPAVPPRRQQTPRAKCPPPLEGGTIEKGPR
jgi:hypothetical protein